MNRLSFRGDSNRRSRNPKSPAAVLDFGLPRYAPKSAIADLGTKMPISGKPEIGGPGMTCQINQSNCTPNTDTPPSVTKIPTRRTRSLGARFQTIAPTTAIAKPIYFIFQRRLAEHVWNVLSDCVRASL